MSSNPSRARRSPYLDPPTVAKIADSAFDLVCVAAEGRMLAVNRAFEQVLGWPAREFISRPFFDFVHPDDLDATTAAYASILHGEDVVDFENRYRHSDGGWRWIQWRAGRLGDGRIHAVGREATAQHLERQLVERTHLIARVGGWQADFATGQVHWTSGTYRLHERDPATYTPDLARCLELYVGESRARMEAAITRLRDHGTPFDIEARVLTGAGRLIDVRAEGIPIIEDGRVTGAFGATGDITEHRRVEALHQQMEAVVRATPQAVVFASASRIVQWLNPAAEALLGVDERVFGRPMGELFTARAAQIYDEQIRVALATQGQWRGETEARHASGEGIPVTSTVVLHRDRHGKPDFLSVSLEDLRERRHLERQIRHGQRLESVGRLAGGLAHDFNNLLTVVLANGEELAEVLAGSDLAPLVEEIIDAARRGSNLTRRLLAFARRDVARPRPVDLLNACVEASRMLRRTLGETITISIEPPATNWPVYIDPTHMEQVLVNLAMNSRDAMPGGGRLTFAIQPVAASDGQGDRVRLSVSDTGEGMTPGVVERAFDPFFTTKGRDQGTGLGLSTCRGVVEQAGGSMHIVSAPGRGTTVVVDLPRAPLQALDPDSVPGAEDPGRGHERLLFIEDEADIRRTVTKGLARRGYVVTAFATAEDAVEAVESGALAPEIIVTDVVLPGMDGPSAVRRLRARIGDIPVVYTSGYAVEKLKSLDLQAPAVAFLRKPYTPRQLGPVIRSLLD